MTSHLWTDDSLLDMIVMPSVMRLIREDELENVTIAYQPGDPKNRVARIVACSEVMEVLLQYPEEDDSIDDVRRRFFDELQIFVAESSFAWGELRG